MQVRGDMRQRDVHDRGVQHEHELTYEHDPHPDRRVAARGSPCGDPPAADPPAADPVAADPVAADPVAADPVAADPVAADPVAADPVAAGRVCSVEDMAVKSCSDLRAFGRGST